MPQEILFAFSIIVLIFSAVCHELAHGLAADTLGDPTPRNQGRLTLNPFPHLDFVGSFLLPVLTYNVGGFIFGWAKPVEFNPYNLNRTPFVSRWGEAIIAAAGPATNFLIAFLFGSAIRIGALAPLDPALLDLVYAIVTVNLSLGVFNLIPIPPLDGSKILFAFLPRSLYSFRQAMERYAFVIYIAVILIGGSFLSPLVGFFARLFTGL